jgi:hypothetical protein
MPGIVRDPRQNQQEGRYGVIQFDNVFAIYDKSIFENMRYRLAGWICEGEFTEFEPDDPEDKTDFPNIKFPINHKVTRLKPLEPQHQPPVVQALYEHFDNNVIRRIMIRNNLKHSNLTDHAPPWPNIQDDFSEIT